MLSRSVYPLPYQFGTEQMIRRNGQLTNTATGAVFVPKNAAPSMKLVHRPATPVSNCLYGKTGTLCQDLSNLPSTEDQQKQWEDLFSNVQLTEYWVDGTYKLAMSMLNYYWVYLLLSIWPETLHCHQQMIVSQSYLFYANFQNKVQVKIVW